MDKLQIKIHYFLKSEFNFFKIFNWANLANLAVRVTFGGQILFEYQNAPAALLLHRRLWLRWWLISRIQESHCKSGLQSDRGTISAYLKGF